MKIDDILRKCTGFEWDEGNLLKNWEKHRVSASERGGLHALPHNKVARRVVRSKARCEKVFFNRPLITLPDRAHSQVEPRFYALGQTDAARYLFIAFTVRNDLIRVISARDMSRRERKVFEKL